MLQNMTTAGTFNPANLHPSEIKSIIHYCKKTGGCLEGPDESEGNYDVTKLSAKEIIATFDYCKSYDVPYCSWYTINESVY